MRVILGAVALACIAGAALALIRGDFRAAVLFAFGFWVSAGWFVAMVAANASVDNMLNEVPPRDEDEEDKR